MPRIARVVSQGYPHHITQRGNYRQKIFSVDTDYAKYLSFVESESKRYGLKILAYCLMPNHVLYRSRRDGDRVDRGVAEGAMCNGYGVAGCHRG